MTGMRRATSWLLLVLGGVLLAAAVPAGYANRTILDADTFADRVDELRLSDEVSALLGREVAQQLVAANPDLVAIAPLVEQIAIGVMGGDALSGPVRVASAQLHRALTTEDSDQLVLRIADVGAVVAGVIGALAPERAPQATEVSATLASVGGQQFAADVIDLVDLVDTLAWLFPLLAIACLVGAALLHPNRWDGLRRVGWAVVTAAAAVGIGIVVGALALRVVGGSERRDAVLDATWEVFVRPIWWSIGLLGVVGALLVLIGSGRAAEWDLTGVARRIAARPATPLGSVGRAVASVIVGLALVVEPAGMLTVAAFLAGLVLLVGGVGGLARRAAAARPDAPERAGRGRVALVAVAACGAAVLVGLAVWAAAPPDDQVAGASGGAVTGTGEVCNGHAELCDRRFDEVSFAATHNSMAVAGKPGWFLGEQGLDIVPQLDFGVRALMVDVWYGSDAGNGAVRTSARSYEEALAVANEELGPEIVAAALRVVDAVAPGEPQGDEALFMCHGLCETGATSFDATLQDIRAWLATHPDEVMTIFVEDHVDADDLAASITDAGLADYLFTPVEGQQLPTLGEMIRSGERLLVMLEERDGRPEHPWLVNGFDFVQETPYTFPTIESFSCDENRGRPDAPLFQVNHRLASFTALVSNAQAVNTAEVLGNRVRRCQEERGLQPTFVSVNYADIGDLIGVVDALNGVAG
jgi:hypothetical protein